MAAFVRRAEHFVTCAATQVVRPTTSRAMARGSLGARAPRRAVPLVPYSTLQSFFSGRGGAPLEARACCRSILSCLRCRPSRSWRVRQTPEQTFTARPARAHSTHDQGQAFSFLQTVQRAASVGRTHLSRTPHLGQGAALSHPETRFKTATSGNGTRARRRDSRRGRGRARARRDRRGAPPRVLGRGRHAHRARLQRRSGGAAPHRRRARGDPFSLAWITSTKRL